VTGARTHPQPTGDTLHPDQQRDGWMRGYIEGHEAGAAVSAITADVVRRLQAQAWDDGYDQGYTDGYQQSRNETGQIIADLAVQHAEIAEAFARFEKVAREQRIADRIAEMERTAQAQHQRWGTQEWAGLESGATLPSADWVPDTTVLSETARRALAAARHPVLHSWAEVRAAVDERTWHRILHDLNATTRAQAIQQTSVSGSARSVGAEAA
jgi:hypothetical protein